MPSAKGATSEGGGSDDGGKRRHGAVSKLAGVVIVSGIAWSVCKSLGCRKKEDGLVDQIHGAGFGEECYVEHTRVDATKKRRGSVKLQSMKQPEMEFDHSGKGYALYDLELALSSEKPTNENLPNLAKVVVQGEAQHMQNFVERNFQDEQLTALMTRAQQASSKGMRDQSINNACGRALKSHLQKQLVFDCRYGWVYDEWKDPSDIAHLGGRGMFSVVPLTGAIFHKTQNLANIAADLVADGLQSLSSLESLYDRIAALQSKVEKDLRNRLNKVNLFGRNCSFICHREDAHTSKKIE